MPSRSSQQLSIATVMRSNHDCSRTSARESAHRRVARASSSTLAPCAQSPNSSGVFAAPIYRAARRDGWWDDPKSAPQKAFRAVGLAECFARTSMRMRAAAAEGHTWPEPEARARDVEVLSHEESRNPRSFLRPVRMSTWPI